MITWREKVSMHNARCGLENYLYCAVTPDIPLKKIVWEPENYMAYIQHLAMHLLGMHDKLDAVYLRDMPVACTLPTHFRCETCGLIEPADWSTYPRYSMFTRSTPEKK